MKARRCKACGTAIRGGGIFLYQSPQGPVYVHGGRRRCLEAYNELPVDDEPCGCGAHPERPPRPRRQRRARSATV